MNVDEVYFPEYSYILAHLHDNSKGIRLKELEETLIKEINKQKEQNEQNTKESVVLKNELKDFLEQKSKLESTQGIFFDEFSALQKDYNQILLDSKRQEETIFSLEARVGELERELLVCQKQREAVIDLLREKEEVVFNLERRLSNLV